MIDRVAHYNLLERLGEGELGPAYRARDTRVGRTSLVKIVPERLAGDPGTRARLVEAAQAAAALSHPHLVTLFELGEADGRLFLAFEFVRGRTLRAEIGGRPLHVRHAVDLAAQVADALAAAHASGIVHGDLRPDTIMVTTKGLAKLLDCGLTAWTRGGRARAAARTGAGPIDSALALTVWPYLAPEETQGAAPDRASDLFSLGAVLYELLAGRPAFAGRTPADVLENVRAAAPPPPSRLNREVPPELDGIVLRALASSPADRYQSAAVLAAELRAVRAMLDIRAGDAEPPKLVAGPARVVRTRRRAVALLLAAGLVGGGWYLGSDAARRAWRRWVGPTPAPIVIVQPFVAAGEDAEVFGEGLAAELAARLGQTPGVQVVARTAARRRVDRAAGRVDAGAVVSGEVDRRGDRLTVHVRLRDAADGVEIWRRRYSGPVDEVLRLLTEAAEGLARALDRTAPARAAEARAASRRVSPQAYGLYLQGRAAASRGAFNQAAAHFARAVEIDPALAEAYAGLVEAQFEEGWRTGAIATRWARQRLREAADSAVQIDPDSPRTRLASALAAPDLTTALGELREVIAQDPTFADAYRHLGDRLAGVDVEAALRWQRRALALDPGAATSYRSLASTLLLAGRWDEAIRTVAASRAAGLDAPWQKDVEARVALARGRAGEAATLLMAGPSRTADVHIWTTAIVALHAAGLASHALDEARSLAERYPDYCPAAALVAVLEGERRGPATRARVNALWQVAAAPDPPPLALVCAALASGAVADGPAAARWIDQIARRDEAVAELQYFALFNLLGRLEGPALMPWSALVRGEVVEGALSRLARARARVRGIVVGALAGLSP